jgi:hypothetical protein
MTVLPSLDIFKKYISNTRDQEFNTLNNILFNKNINILITKNYISFLESKIEDFEQVQALIMELYDSNRTSEGTIDNEEENLYEKLYLDNVNEINCLFPISIEDDFQIKHFKYSSISKLKKNKEYILFELLKSNNISFHYYDFKSNLQIQKLIKTIFLFPQKTSRISIYNRYSEFKYLTFLKDKSIYYYNLIRGDSHSQKTEYIRINSELKENLGRNLILNTTRKTDKIHERKIFFNSFILTFDNAFDNLLITEPNWKIDITIDRGECIREWSKKNQYFSRLN